jgi:hypothetical protein
MIGSAQSLSVMEKTTRKTTKAAKPTTRDLAREINQRASLRKMEKDSMNNTQRSRLEATEHLTLRYFLRCLLFLRPHLTHSLGGGFPLCR